MKTTTRKYDHNPHENYVERTEGEPVASIELSQNAKGKWQPTIKLHFASIDEMQKKAPDTLRNIVSDLKTHFALADE